MEEVASCQVPVASEEAQHAKPGVLATGNSKLATTDLQRLEKLLREIEADADPRVRGRMQEVVQTLMDFHGAAVAAMLDHVAAAGEPGQAIIDAMGSDELVGSLLLLYGLHPLDLPTRVGQALEKVRPYLGSHGGNVELLEVTDQGVIRLRLEGSCHGCPSSQATLKSTIEEAVFAAAPDVAEILVEGAVEEPAPDVAQPAGFVPLSQVTAGTRRPAAVAARS